LLDESSRCLVQVGDARNLHRTLNLTTLLAELGVPMVYELNTHDDAAACSISRPTKSNGPSKPPSPGISGWRNSRRQTD
jgi:Fe2+ transport system protein B